MSMRKLMVLFVMLVSAKLAWSQRYCEVELIGQSGRVIEVFRGSESSVGGLCRQALRECNRQLRLQGRGVSCRAVDYSSGGRVDDRYSDRSSVQSLLRRTNIELAIQGLNSGIGRCNVSQGSYYSACDYYVKINGLGVDGGTGCADSRYTQHFGCYGYDELENSGCMLRKLLQRGMCL